MINFYKNKKSILATFLLAVFGVAIFGLKVYGAGEKQESGWLTIGHIGENAILAVIGGIASIFTTILGFLLSGVIDVILILASYNDFINETVVKVGWTQVRDLSNMFFILILLVIAFATILRVESYNIKKQLPKLIIMAILINFSKTICGLIIEFAQVIMMTFMNSINANGSGLINMMGVEKFLTIARDHPFTKDVDFTLAVVGYVLAVIFLVISLVVLIAFMWVLLMRMVMLWVYIVLSPLAYLLAAFPQGQSYAGRWWDEFVKYVVTGPVLAFFLWLAMVSARATPNSLSGSKNCFGPSAIVCTDNFLNFLVAIGMLLGGLMITSQIGGVVGQAAGTALSDIKSGKIFSRTRKLGNYAGRKFAAKTGVELRPAKIIDGIKESFKQSEVRDNGEARKKAGALFEAGGVRSWVGALGTGADGANAFLSGPLGYNGFKNAFRTFRNGPGKIKAANDAYATDKEEIETKISELESQNETPERNKAIKEQRDLLKKLEIDHGNNMAVISAPTAFEGRSAERALINEEKKKAAEFKTSEELVLNFKKAMSAGNNHRAIAIAEQLADDGDINELLGAHGYGASAIDLHRFVQNELKGKNGISEKDALRYQNYISSGAQKAGQWELAKTVGVNVDGTMRSLIKETTDVSGNIQYDDEDHALVAYGDLSKKDPQELAKIGRLALGGEDINGEYKLSNLGKLVMQNMGGAFKDHDKRVMSKTAQSILSSKNIEEVLKDHPRKKEIMEALQSRTTEQKVNLKQQYQKIKTI